MSKLQMKPEYKHDCELCEYKTTKRIGPTLYDIYKCKHSYVARFGNDGSEYTSIPIMVKDTFINDDKWGLIIGICEDSNEDNGGSI